MEGQDVIVKKLEDLDRILSTYSEDKLHFKKINVAEARLDLTTKEIAAMTTEEINVWRFEVAQYLVGLQKEINKHKKNVNWANSALRLYVGIKAVDCAGYTFEEKKNVAMKNDNYVKNLNTIIMQAQAYIDTLDFMSPKINSLVEIAKDIIWSRKREDYHDTSR
jgi:hypothetical protein